MKKLLRLLYLVFLSASSRISMSVIIAAPTEASGGAWPCKSVVAEVLGSIEKLFTAIASSQLKIVEGLVPEDRFP
jgi:hypothetical protein